MKIKLGLPRVTSFSQYKTYSNLPKERLVSISNSTPTFFQGVKYDSIVPPFRLVESRKKGLISEDEFIDRYVNQLEKLNKDQILKDLKGKVLFCWCSSKGFCHRFVFIQWLKGEKITGYRNIISYLLSKSK